MLVPVSTGRRDPVKKAILALIIVVVISTFNYVTKTTVGDPNSKTGFERQLFSVEEEPDQSEDDLTTAAAPTTEINDNQDDDVGSGDEPEDDDVDDEMYSNSTCIKPEITHFPNPLINKKTRQHGAIILHILLAIYVFIGLTIVCNDYFVPALTRVSDALCLTPDVAGATLMAAGSSAPELATSVIAVFVSKGEVSVSSVIGSAVFNITLVIAICSLVSPRPLQLKWYPVIRDSTAYLVCIIMFLCIMANNVVSLPEALFFVCMYAVYCLGMKYNDALETWVTDTCPIPDTWRHEAPADKDVEQAECNGNIKENGVKANGTCNGDHVKEQNEKKTKEENQIKDPLVKPVALDDGQFAVVSWYITLPLRYMTVYTIPDCRTKDWSRYFLLSFAMSVFWICLYSYILVWMVTIIGFTFNIADTIMSLTFVAAAVSVQDALSGMAVVKEGYGDMAVSNAIGSNVFDFLICLGVPWLIQTLFINPGEDVVIVHKGVAYSALILISTVVFLIGVSHFNNWKMDKKYGTILLVWYFVLITLASLYETNVFGNFNPEECESEL